MVQHRLGVRESKVWKLPSSGRLTDDVSVEIHTDDGDPQLAAAIELVSPRNEDRAKARKAFAAKFAEHLRRGRGVVIVDVDTTRRADLHAELLAELGVNVTDVSIGSLFVMSYRSVGRDQQEQLLAWPVVLDIGGVLPTVPLWLGSDVSVPLNLEASYDVTCLDLRIRQAG